MNLFESLLKENKKISKQERKKIKEEVGINDTLVGQEWRTHKDSPNYEENELFEIDPVNSDFQKLNDEPIEIEYVADEHDESRDFVPSFWFENKRHYLDDYVRVHDNPWFSSYDNFPNYIHGIEGDVYSHPLFVEIIDGDYVNVYRDVERKTEALDFDNYYKAEDAIYVPDSDGEKYECHCSNCGYTTYMTKDDYENLGRCPRCYDHHGGFEILDDEDEEDFEESKKVVRESTTNDFLWDSWGNGRYRVVYKNQECDVYSDWKHKGRYVIDRIEGKRISNAQNLTKAEVKNYIRNYVDNGSINESKK